jgi:hypothetical protein
MADIIDLISEKAKQIAKKAIVEKAGSGINLLFHDFDRTPWANIIRNGHRETFAVDSDEMRDYIRQELWAAGKTMFGEGLTISRSKLAERIDMLKARALFDGPQHEVFLRTGAHHDGALYVDLCDAKWRAIRIGRFGWEVVNTPPIFFHRSKGMLSLPVPEPGGSIDELLPFLNIAEADFVLIVAWLLAALRPRGPYPPLALTGPPGAAKSTLTLLLRSLVDPDSIPLRSPPRNLGDLNVEALYSHCLVFNNVSRVSQWLSDALCRLADGGGSAERQFYTKREMVRFKAARPVILNGIVDFVTAPDLQNRSIIITLAEIAIGNRKTESELFAEFEAARGRIFGALLDRMVVGVKNLPDTKLVNPPRMAEFCTLSVACGLENFQSRYQQNLLDGTLAVLEGDELARAIKAMIGRRVKPWIGTATQLAKELKRFGFEPENARALSAGLRRIVPSLRIGYGITVKFLPRTGTERRIEISSSFASPPASSKRPKRPK